MRTLDDAWQWYKITRDLLRLVDRLATNHWDRLDWEPGESPAVEGVRRAYKGLARDEKLRMYTAEALSKRAGSGLAPLDDLAVLLLFSAFESIVRDLVSSEVELERESVRHPALQRAVNVALDQLREGSFFQVLEPYKAAHADLIEEVNQVRRYRNWVAHGRGGERPPHVTPELAHERLSRFLRMIADRLSSVKLPPDVT